MIPGMYVAFRGNTSQDLWWTTTSNGNSFSTAIDTSAQLYDTPGVAVFHETLYAVYPGKDSRNFFWMTTSDGKTWSQSEVSSYQLGTGAALAVFNEYLYAAYAGKDSSNFFWAVSQDGKSWTQHNNSAQLAYTPALAVFKGALYAAYAGKDSKSFFWATTSDGINWSQYNKPWTMSAGPGLAVFNGRLYSAFRGSSSHDLYLTYTEDGVNWEEARNTSIKVGSSVALVVFRQTLYAFYKSDNDGNVFCWATTTDGVTWTQHSNGLLLSAGPGAAVSGLSIGSVVLPDDLDQSDLTIFGGASGTADVGFYTEYGSSLSGKFGFPYGQTWFVGVDTLGIISLTFSSEPNIGYMVTINDDTPLWCSESDSLTLSFSNDGLVTVSSSLGTATARAGANLADTVPCIQKMYKMVAGSPTLQQQWDTSAIDTLYAMGLPQGMLSNLDWQSAWYNGGTVPCSKQFAEALQSLQFTTMTQAADVDVASVTLTCSACKSLTVGVAASIFAVGIVIMATNPAAAATVEVLAESLAAYAPAAQLAAYCGMTMEQFTKVVAAAFFEAAGGQFISDCAEALCEQMGAC